MTSITYKGKTIARLYPSGYYEVYSSQQGRFIKCDTLKAAKQIIDSEK